MDRSVFRTSHVISPSSSDIGEFGGNYLKPGTSPNHVLPLTIADWTERDRDTLLGRMACCSVFSSPFRVDFPAFDVSEKKWIFRGDLEKMIFSTNCVLCMVSSKIKGNGSKLQ